jgi:hypothetical protein
MPMTAWRAEPHARHWHGYVRTRSHNFFFVRTEKEKKRSLDRFDRCIWLHVRPSFFNVIRRFVVCFFDLLTAAARIFGRLVFLARPHKLTPCHLLFFLVGLFSCASLGYSFDPCRRRARISGFFFFFILQFEWSWVCFFLELDFGTAKSWWIK